ncbi:hypothetical protein NBRC111894_4685 [Sporolactobacillus inulinus]|uniref:Uncharacterized protein n=1 Tax=Sporolactobacillus inulinus TaxID=2078 RepID=A0A4Y1ZJG3_9BACL|nr:hypothetical protein NBRC111894_4685 [Sporolactobacillus inulinus]
MFFYKINYKKHLLFDSIGDNILKVGGEIFRHLLFWPVRQVVKTPPFHGGFMGSNPVRVIIYLILYELCDKINWCF